MNYREKCLVIHAGFVDWYEVEKPAAKEAKSLLFFTVNIYKFYKM